ncbi:hypothetical protein V8918_02795 [Ralstonia mannitolilytica]|uniref:hypothetical protein n=1 Tax=Ralstonia mannitolilytica TaxID=105219 RepID=UPI003B83A8BE
MDLRNHHTLNDDENTRELMNAFLKNSDYLTSALNEIRSETGVLLAEFLGTFVAAGLLSAEHVGAMLFVAEKDSGRPSRDSTRRHLIASIRAHSQIVFARQQSKEADGSARAGKKD